MHFRSISNCNSVITAFCKLLHFYALSAIDKIAFCNGGEKNAVLRTFSQNPL